MAVRGRRPSVRGRGGDATRCCLSGHTSHVGIASVTLHGTCPQTLFVALTSQACALSTHVYICTCATPARPPLVVLQG